MLAVVDEITIPTLYLDLPLVLDLHQQEVDLTVEEEQECLEFFDGKNTDINGLEEKEEMICTNVHGVPAFFHKPLLGVAMALTTACPRRGFAYSPAFSPTRSGALCARKAGVRV